MKPVLLVLAAGMGSRYGGLKQMDGLGPNGETIIDYSIYDAVLAGFGKVVYIVRESFLDDFRNTVKEKYGQVKCADGSPLEFEFVTQELNRIPPQFVLNPERKKPWGTAHAVQMAAQTIKSPFVVINGDDYYGRESFKIAGDWCREHATSKGSYAIVGFKLGHTLSESGGVSRGICHYDSEHHLTNVVEHTNVAREEDGTLSGENTVNSKICTLNENDLCSMNMWCFTPDYFAKNASVFEQFLLKWSWELKKEFYIPYAVDSMIKSGTAKCEVLSTPDHWFGVTFKEDRPGVVAKFADLVSKGVYPSPLYRVEAD